MSEEIEGEPEQKPTQVIRHVISKEDDSKYEKMLEELALNEFNEKLEELKELAPEKSDEIDELMPSTINQFELNLHKELAEKKPSKKRSTGSVSLIPPKTESSIDDLLEKEFEDPYKMMDELQKAKRQPNLRPEDRMRLKQIENHLWDKYSKSRSKPTRMLIETPLPPKGEDWYIKCPWCFQLIPHSERLAHVANCKAERTKGDK